VIKRMLALGYGPSIVLILISCSSPASEPVRGGSPEDRAGTTMPVQATGIGTYRLYQPAAAVEAVVVLPPGFGGAVDSFELTSPATPSTLPTALATRGVLTVVAVPTSGTLYETEESVRALDDLLAAVFAEYGVGPVPVVIEIAPTGNGIPIRGPLWTKST
jgi:hypothetical protein